MAPFNNVLLLLDGPARKVAKKRSAVQLAQRASPDVLECDLLQRLSGSMVGLNCVKFNVKLKF